VVPLKPEFTLKWPLMAKKGGTAWVFRPPSLSERGFVFYV
jgi:hypothetical protein